MSFVVLMLLARKVAPDAFGVVALASVFTAFAHLLIDQGFTDAIVQRLTLDREHLDTAFWSNILLALLLAAVGVSVSGLAARLFREPQLAPVVASLSLSLILGALGSVQQAILRREMAFKSLAIRSLVAITAGGAVAVVMASRGFGVWSLVAKILVGDAVSVVVLWQVTDWRPRFVVSMKHFRELFSFGANITGSNFVDFFSRHSDDFLIGYFLGPVVLGYYTLAYNLLLVMTDVLTVVPYSALFPAFSRLQREPDRMRRSFYEVTQLISMIALPVFGGLLLLAPEAVTIVYGAKWAPSIPVIRVLMMIGILQSASYMFGNVLKAMGKPLWLLGILSLSAVLNVVGFALSVRLGIVAVAMAYTIVGYLVSPLYFALIGKLLQVESRVYLRQYAPGLAGSLVMAAAVLAAKYLLGQQSSVYLRAVACTLAGGLAYLSVVCTIARSPSREIVRLGLLLLGSRQRSRA